MTQEIKVLATEPGNLSLIPGTHMIKGKGPRDEHTCT